MPKKSNDLFNKYVSNGNLSNDRFVFIICIIISIVLIFILLLNIVISGELWIKNDKYFEVYNFIHNKNNILLFLMSIDNKDKLLNNRVSASELESSVTIITEDISKSRSIIDKILDLYNSKNNEFMADISDWWTSFQNIMDSWNSILLDLSFEELGALAHITSSVFILLCLFSIIIIIYSDFLLIYLKIEDKYPKIGRFIRLRRKFQQFYLFINFMFIIIILLAIIFINLNVLI